MEKKLSTLGELERALEALTMTLLKHEIRYYVFNNIHEKITRFWLAESSAVQV